MYSLLYNFFYNSVFSGGEGILSFAFNIGDNRLNGRQYLCNLCALVSTIFIVVLCCLFVYKIIKLIGGLIR